jgi:S-adenosylmethionine:tRNA ribosyltransferase-isomerase
VVSTLFDGSQVCLECAYDYDVPPGLDATRPPEARGIARDGVRLLVTSASDPEVRHHAFRDLPDLLAPGDLLVVNDSATLAAAVDVIGTDLTVHFSTEQPDGRWVVELRRDRQPYADSRAGTRLRLPGGASITLAAPYLGSHGRLWVADVDVPAPLPTYLAKHGRPIRYRYVEREWPLAAYQTVFGREPGSAEMPSAGRPFTPEVVAALVRRGVQIAPITLHTGVASLELTEPPYPERYAVPPATAEIVNLTRAAGRRIIAVGTTVVRALESAAGAGGWVQPSSGWTDLVVEPGRGVLVVEGLLTGLHEPKASHLLMLEAIGGREQLDRAYQAAIRERYLWHEFGDVHLLLP